MSLKFPHCGADIVLLALEAYDHVWINTNDWNITSNMLYNILDKGAVAVKKKEKKRRKEDM